MVPVLARSLSGRRVSHQSRRTDVRALCGARVHRDEHAALELEGERRRALRTRQLSERRMECWERRHRPAPLTHSRISAERGPQPRVNPLGTHLGKLDAVLSVQVALVHVEAARRVRRGLREERRKRRRGQRARRISESVAGALRSRDGSNSGRSSAARPPVRYKSTTRRAFRPPHARQKPLAAGTTAG
jgi:hypothetical protein